MTGRQLPRPPSRPPPEWKAFLRAVGRRRRALENRPGGPATPYPRPFLARVTRASFRLDGIDVSDWEAAAALARGSAGRAFRSRLGQRLRNHVAILRRIGRVARGEQSLTAEMVLRWYTSVSCGLSSAGLDGPSLARLDHVVQQINLPPAGPRSAVESGARLYGDLLSRPVVPGFNGILSRLLLTYHLARCGLPPLVFGAPDEFSPADSVSLLRYLLRVIPSSYDRLLEKE